MELYFAPLACSMASRIALYEGDIPAGFIQVDNRTKRLADGTDYLPINPLGQVPVLRTDEGQLLRENAGILGYLGARSDALRPDDEVRRLEVAQFLSFIGTELHKLVFNPLLDPASNDGAKQYARAKAENRFDFLQARLADREFLVERFSVADAYLVVVLNWTRFVGIDLARWPAVQAYFERIGARPAVARAMAEEFSLFREEQARRQVA
jgi:glutathione S-transferase